MSDAPLPPPYGQQPAQPYGYGHQPAQPYGYGHQPAQPYGYGPRYVDPAAKSRLVAGLLGIFLGGLGVHRFYLGYTSIGVAQILVTVLTFGVGAIWGLVEGIMILTRSTITTDEHGRPLRD
jgi:hypothetical protein